MATADKVFEVHTWDLHGKISWYSATILRRNFEKIIKNRNIRLQTKIIGHFLRFYPINSMYVLQKTVGEVFVVHTINLLDNISCYLATILRRNFEKIFKNKNFRPQTK